MELKIEMLIFWIVFSLFFIFLVNSAHFLTEFQQSVVLIVGLGVIIIGVIRTGIE